MTKPKRVLIVAESEVESLLPMRECIEVMVKALASLARGEVHQPLRNIVRVPEAQGLLGLMPAFWSGATPYYGLKEVCVFPGNPARGLDTHLGAVLLHSGNTGELLAIVNASAVTAIRTAAVSAVATRLLARRDAHSLAIIGAGVQARSHLKAIPLVRDIREVRIFSREKERSEKLAAFANEYINGASARVSGSVEEAVREAEIIVTATSSRNPVLNRDWIAAGTHINAVGSSIATTREIDSATVAAAKLFVDRRESTVNEAGDYLFALQEGAIQGPEHIRGEIGEILLGKIRGRETSEEITLFKSLGLAIEDLAAAAFLFERAELNGTGTWVEF